MLLRRFSPSQSLIFLHFVTLQHQRNETAAHYLNYCKSKSTMFTDAYLSQLERGSSDPSFEPEKDA
jgi:hypothetical protein